jgi:hypothetical protein
MGKTELDTSKTISVEIMNTIFGLHENWKSTINVVEDKLLVIVLREGWKGYKICEPNISISLPKYDQLRRKLILCATEMRFLRDCFVIAFNHIQQTSFL